MSDFAHPEVQKMGNTSDLMIKHITLLAIVLTSSISCSNSLPASTPITLEESESEHEEWRNKRRKRLVTPPGGPVLWYGLFEIGQGETGFGSDPALSIILPQEDSPPLAGTLVRTKQEVMLHTNTGAEIYLEDGIPIEDKIVLENDRSKNTTYISLGSLGMRIHSEPGTDRLWLRVWKTELDEGQVFKLPEFFPVTTEWLVPARLERYPSVRKLPLADVTGGMLEKEAIGELVFRKDDREHRLIVTGNKKSKSYFVSMWDSTAITDTYQAGRYLSVPKVNKGGWTTIDFNRAYNPPCVFTAFSVCSLPPPDNRLKLSVTAGEKRPDQPYY